MLFGLIRPHFARLGKGKRYKPWDITGELRCERFVDFTCLPIHMVPRLNDGVFRGLRRESCLIMVDFEFI